MKSSVGLQAVKEMAVQGTPVQIIDDDGDKSLIASAKNQLGISLAKTVDRNHSVILSIVKPKRKD